MSWPWLLRPPRTASYSWKMGLLMSMQDCKHSASDSPSSYRTVPCRASSSLSDPYCRAVVMADRRSPWADLRFLMRRLDLVGSACSISVFL
uniref:Uncharacterized protein n=1 Tax=Anguilla anguilla TaxID=7936 RepID=A0A0E9U9Y4_ANGAN